MSTITEMELATSNVQFDKMHKALDELHAAHNRVYIDAQALKNLLYDHSQFCALCEDEFKEFIKLVHGTKDGSREAQFSYERYADMQGYEPTNVPDVIEVPYYIETGERANVESRPEQQDGQSDIGQTG